MRTYQKIIAGGLVVAGLSGLFGCDNKSNDNLEQKVTKAPYSSVESEEVNRDYERFRSEDNIGFSKDQASRTAANLSLAGAFSGKTSDELDSLYDTYRSMDNIGFSKDAASEVSATLTIATVLNQGNQNEVIGMYKRFRSEDNIGFSKDQASRTAAQLTLATVMREEGYKLKK